MRTQGERQNYNWRPNDYGSTTLTRYNLEAEHWTKAFRDAAGKHKVGDITTPVASLVSLIDLILSLTLTLIILLVHGVTMLFKSSPKAESNTKTGKTLSDSEITETFNDETCKEINIYG